MRLLASRRTAISEGGFASTEKKARVPSEWLKRVEKKEKQEAKKAR